MTTHAVPYSVAQADGATEPNAVRARIESIIDQHGFTGIVQPYFVEAWMRCDSAPLETLTTEQFEREAGEAIACVMATSNEVSRRLAVSFGLAAVTV